MVPEFNEAYLDAIVIRNWDFITKIYNSNPVYQIILMENEHTKKWTEKLNPYLTYRYENQGKHCVDFVVQEKAKQLALEDCIICCNECHMEFYSFEDAAEHKHDL